MHEKCFLSYLRALPRADCWLLVLCLLPLGFFVRMLYGYGKMIAHYSMHGGGGGIYSFYPVIGLVFAGCAVLVPMLTVLLRAARVPRFLVWLWALGVLHHCLAALNYMRLVDVDTEASGFVWASEVHMVLRFLSPEIPEGVWIGVVRLALWLAIAVLFIRKCRSLGREERFGLKRENPVSA